MVNLEDLDGRWENVSIYRRMRRIQIRMVEERTMVVLREWEIEWKWLMD